MADSDSSDEAQIGPALPPHFKLSHTANELEEDGEDSFGPTLPANIQPNTSTSFQGPTLSAKLNTNDDDDNNESEDDSFGPALPPGFASESRAERQVGPSLPDNFVPDEGNEDEEDEFVGPVPEGMQDKNHMYDPSTRNFRKNDDKITQREKWMLEPGKKLANKLQTKSVTQFSQKSSSKKDAPLSKQQRLEMEMIAEKEGKIKDFLDKYEKNNKRDVSLLDQHRTDLKKNNKKLKPEKAERREFDRDRDLNVPRMDNKKKNAFLKEASSTFTDRFSSGKFEKFL